MERMGFLVRALRARGDIFSLTGHFNQAMTDFRRIRRFKKYGYLSDLGISEVCEKQGKYRKALEHARRASETCPDIMTEIQIMNHRVFILMRLGNLNEVKRMGRTVQRLVDRRGINRKEAYLSRAYFYYNFAYFYLQTGRLEAALDYVLKSIRIASLNNDHRRLANSYNIASLIYKRMNKRKLSNKYLQKGLQYFIRIGDISQVAGCYNNLGSLMQDHDEAIHYYSKALSIFRRIGLNMGIFETTHNLANKYMALGMCRKALSGYRSAKLLCEKMHYKLGSAYSLAGMAAACKFLGDYKGALRHLSRAIKVDLEMDNREGLVESTFLVAGIKLERNSRDAFAWIKRTRRLAEKLNDCTTLVEILYEELEYLILKREYGKIAKLKKRLARLKRLKLPQRESIFLKIADMRMRSIKGGRMDSGQSRVLAEPLDDFFRKTRDRELIYYAGMSVFDHYLKWNRGKARSAYLHMRKSIEKDEMRDFYPAVLFLGAKLLHAQGRPVSKQLKEAAGMARVIGKKRLLVEISRWSRSGNVELR
jgi:tetratricopeptide (TPR) repeat protein